MYMLMKLNENMDLTAEILRGFYFPVIIEGF